MIKYTQKTLFLLALAFIMLWVNCQDKEAATPKTETLLDYNIVGMRSAENLRATATIFRNSAGLDIPEDKMIFDVSIYRVQYRTRYKGQDITASGIVFIPETLEPVSTVSFHHGTIAANREAPSQMVFDNPQMILLSAFSSMGTVTVFPDFIGFGSSVDITHPYYNYEYSTAPMVDALYAAKNLAAKFGHQQSPDLYLAGYSQGGYVTMATHRWIEDNGITGYELRASFPSSGGYDMIGVRDFFFGQETYDQPFFLAYVAESFRTVYDWPASALQDVFQEPYASLIPSLFDGSKSGGQINDLLTTTIADLVTAEYISNPDNVKYNRFTEAFVENSLINWVPTIPVYLYHGDEDITVPYQNSVDVYARLQSNGTSPANLSFTTLPGANHYTGFIPYINEVIKEFLELEGK